MALRDLLRNNPLMMSAGFVMGLVLGGFGELTSYVINIDLVLMMSLALCGLSFRGLNLKSHLRTTLLAIVLTFGLSTWITVLIAFLFEDPIRSGWIIEAAVPSAIGVIPFAFLLKGRVENAMVSTATIYFLALVLTPLLVFVTIGKEVNPLSLLSSVMLLILLPIALSRGVRKLEIRPDVRTILINITFMIVAFAVVGANRKYFYTDPVLIAGLLLASFVRIFIPGSIVYFLARRTSFDKFQTVNAVLFSTYKNTGMAAALAAALIGEQAALPAAICTPVEIMWLFFMTKFLFTPQYFTGGESRERQDGRTHS